jgi:hypothetical protein
MSSYWQSHVCRLPHRTYLRLGLQCCLSSTERLAYVCSNTLLPIVKRPLPNMSIQMNLHLLLPVKSTGCQRHHATRYLLDNLPTLAHWLKSRIEPVWVGTLSGFHTRCTICEQPMCDYSRKAAILRDEEAEARHKNIAFKKFQTYWKPISSEANTNEELRV